MGSTKSLLGEDSSIDRPSCFTGECYDFWKIKMQMFLESQGVEVWNVLEEVPLNFIVLISYINLSLNMNGMKMINKSFMIKRPKTL